MCDKPQIGDECLFYDDPSDYVKCECVLIATTSDGRFIDEDDLIWKYCERIKKKVTVVKKASEIIKWLEDNGYKANKYGIWIKNGKLSFTPRMFSFCGEEQTDNYKWLPEWLEEKEV